VKKCRQRGIRAVLSAVGVFGVLVMVAGCEARSSVEAAQTVVVAAQTALPGAQATAQAGATLVSGALTGSQAVLTTLQGVLSEADVKVTTTPDGAESSAVTDVTIDATDVRGALGPIDSHARQAAALAALAAASQYYPNATIALNVVDSAGNPLVSGTKAPGQPPAIQ
jgi:hypothetical protein